MDSHAIVAALETLVPGARVEAVPAIDQPTVLVGADSLVAACTALRDAPALGFTALVDIVGVDMMPRVPRFDVNYSLVATSVVARLRVKVRVDGDTPSVPSVVGVWPAAGFLEREVWDLLGVTFDGHPDLRRLLTPDDWTGHPLRKDYPVQIDAPVKVHEPLQMTEEQFRANIRHDRQSRKGDA
jgi:NADH-quinone oxidoreductase subunit C